MTASNNTKMDGIKELLKVGLLLIVFSVGVLVVLKLSKTTIQVTVTQPVNAYSNTNK